MKWIKVNISVFIITICMGWMPVLAEESESEVKQIKEMVVKESAGAPGFKTSASKTTIEIDNITTIGPPNSVIDVFKTQAIIDFRGQSDLDPGVDSVYLRGFEAKRFVTAIDGVTIQKTGGRKSSNIVDYAQLPTFLIESIEVLPGPHSALYDAKSIGGVLNMVTKAPVLHETQKPDFSLTTSYGSYNTLSNTAVMQGSVQSFTYDLAYRNYMTDGYLRNSETEMNIGFGRFGYILPSKGFIAFSASVSDIDRNSPVNNPGTTESYAVDYDSDYPITSGSVWQPCQNPTWDSISNSFRLNYDQYLPVGRLQFDAYYGTEKRDREYMEWVDKNDYSQGTYSTSMETEWWQQGGKLQDDINWAQNHTTTIGCDFVQLYDEGADDLKTERIRKKGAFVQHQWGVLPSVDLKLGLRYEDVNIWVSNGASGSPHNTAYPQYIEREWDQFIPKSFTTWKLDSIAPWLRDSSVSAGVSKIWHAPDYHGDYNPQGKPAGITLEPEHGIGYDLVFDRRLWRDITLKLNYAFYEIEDYIATNRQYAIYSGGSAGALRYSDYKINLEKVHRHGVDTELGGHLTDDLSFYLTYAWQRFFNKGDEDAAETELDQRAQHRVSAGLRYALKENTTLMLDYYYQSSETTENVVESSPGVYTFKEVNNSSYNVFDIGLQQVCFKQAGWLKNGTLNLYVKNLLDEEYFDAEGFPATDRTYGISFSVKI